MKVWGEFKNDLNLTHLHQIIFRLNTEQLLARHIPLLGYVYVHFQLRTAAF